MSSFRSVFSRAVNFDKSNGMSTFLNLASRSSRSGATRDQSIGTAERIAEDRRMAAIFDMAADLSLCVLDSTRRTCPEERFLDTDRTEESTHENEKSAGNRGDARGDRRGFRARTRGSEGESIALRPPSRQTGRRHAVFRTRLGAR